MASRHRVEPPYPQTQQGVSVCFDPLRALTSDPQLQHTKVVSEKGDVTCKVTTDPVWASSIAGSRPPPETPRSPWGRFLLHAVYTPGHEERFLAGFGTQQSGSPSHRKPNIRGAVRTGFAWCRRREALHVHPTAVQESRHQGRVIPSAAPHGRFLARDAGGRLFANRGSFWT
jgi:hypothetical protein